MRIDVIDFRPLFIRLASCKEVRNQLLISHDEGVKRLRAPTFVRFKPVRSPLCAPEAVKYSRPTF